MMCPSLGCVTMRWRNNGYASNEPAPSPLNASNSPMRPPEATLHIPAKATLVNHSLTAYPGNVTVALHHQDGPVYRAENALEWASGATIPAPQTPKAPEGAFGQPDGAGSECHYSNRTMPERRIKPPAAPPP